MGFGRKDQCVFMILFFTDGTLGKFCTLIPDNRTEYKSNHLKLIRN